MGQSDFKKRYDPEMGRFTRQHIYGEGVMDILKTIGAKVIGKTIKQAAKTAATKAVSTAATKTGQHVGEKAGDKIINFLTKKKKDKKVTFDEAMKPSQEIVKILSNSTPTTKIQKPKSITQQEINKRLNLILSDD